MDKYLQFLISGIALGSVYSLVSLGITLAFRTTGVLNFAQGSFVMVSGLTFITLRDDMPLIPLLLLVIALGVLLGAVVERIAIAPARHLTHESLVIITIGLAEVLRGLALLTFGDRTKYTDSFVAWRPLHVAGATVSMQTLFVVLGAVVAVVVTLLALERTRLGRALRASAMDSDMSILCGVSPKMVTFVTLGVAGGLAAIAGSLLAPVTGMGFESGLDLAIKGLFAAVLGGLGSLKGALWGGMTFGLLEAFALFAVPTYSVSITLGLVVLLLVVRPQGLTSGTGARVGAL